MARVHNKLVNVLWKTFREPEEMIRSLVEMLGVGEALATGVGESEFGFPAIVQKLDNSTMCL